MLFDIDGEDNQLASTPKLGDSDYGVCAIYCLPANQILRLSGFPLTLPFDDGTSEDSTFNIKDAQSIVVHLIVSMQGHHILTAMDFLAHSF